MPPTAGWLVDRRCQILGSLGRRSDSPCARCVTAFAGASFGVLGIAAVDPVSRRSVAANALSESAVGAWLLRSTSPDAC